MAAHVELQLMAKVIEESNLSTVLEEGITLDTFGNPEARAIFKHILNYHQGKKTRNLVPPLDQIERFFGTSDLPPPPRHTTIEALCHEVKEEWLRRGIEDIWHTSSETYEEDPAGTVSRMSQDIKLLQSRTEVSRDLVFSDSTESMKREYLQVKNAEGMVGVPWPIGWGYHKEGKPKILKKTGRHHHPLNEQSGGMRGGDFILLYGRPKSMKTWTLVDMIVECYYYLNCRVLVFTKEMTPEQLRWRIAARILRLDYLMLKNATLEEEDEEEFFELLDTLKSEEERLKKRGHNRSMLITTGWTGDTVRTGMQSLEMKVEEFGPDIVFADSVYLMKAMKNKEGAFWQDIAEIAYGLKDLAMVKRIPVVATSQANRRGEELKGSSMAEIAYGDTFGQACDYAIRVIKTEDDDGNIFLSLIFSGAREMKLPGLRLSVEVAQSFMLDQIFESQRQIMAQFRAEEEAIAREEEEAAKKINREKQIGRRHLQLDNMHQQHPDRGDGVE
jgi:replicative DNA helicase